jgi:putative molybdopterin biosynthesis protein
MRLTNTQMLQTDHLLTTDELARRLRVSRMTVYRMVRNQSIPYLRIGRELRFNAESVLQRLQMAKG